MGCYTTSAQVCWILFCKLDFYSANTQQSHSWMAFVCMCKCVTGEDVVGLLRMTQSSPSIFEKGGHSTSSQLQSANKDNESLLHIVISCCTTWLHMVTFLTISVLSWIRGQVLFSGKSQNKAPDILTSWSLHQLSVTLWRKMYSRPSQAVQHVALSGQMYCSATPILQKLKHLIS